MADAVTPKITSRHHYASFVGITTTRPSYMAPRHDQKNKQKRKKDGEMKMEEKEHDVRGERGGKAPEGGDWDRGLRKDESEEVID